MQEEGRVSSWGTQIVLCMNDSLIAWLAGLSVGERMGWPGGGGGGGGVGVQTELWEKGA